MKKKFASILITHSQFFLSFSAEYLCRWTFLLQFNKDLEILGRSRATLLRKLTFLFIFSFVLKFSGSIFIKRVRQMTRCVFVFGTKGRYDRLPLAWVYGVISRLADLFVFLLLLGHVYRVIFSFVMLMSVKNKDSRNRIRFCLENFMPVHVNNCSWSQHYP